MRNLTIFTRTGFVSAPLFYRNFRVYWQATAFLLQHKKYSPTFRRDIIYPKPNWANRLISGFEVDYPSTLAGHFEEWMQLSELNIQILFDNVNFQNEIGALSVDSLPR